MTQPSAETDLAQAILDAARAAGLDAAAISGLKRLSGGASKETWAFDVEASDGSRRELALQGLFVAIGYDPRTHLVHGKLDLTEAGTVWVDGRSSRTSVPGIFAAGDVIDPTYRQAVTAAGSGTVAALDVEHYLASLGEAGAPDATADPIEDRPGADDEEPLAAAEHSPAVAR